MNGFIRDASLAIALCAAGSIPALGSTPADRGSEPAPPVESLLDEPQDERAQLPQTAPVDPGIYHRQIARLESGAGAYASGLSEQLLGLGNAYQLQGLHEEAIGVFKRAVHVSRVNNGLISEEQVPILQRLITSLAASGDYEGADERQFYLYRVQRQLYGSDSPLMSKAMLERARWERRAYDLSVGESAFNRLLTMWDLYGGVVGNIAAREGNYSLSLLIPLNGLLETQYLIASYRGESSAGFEIGGRSVESPEEGRFAGVQRTNYKKGQAVITAMREIHAFNESANSRLSAEALLELGNWHMWHQQRERALVAYQQCWDELASLDDGAALIAEYFGSPQLLPTFLDLGKKLGTSRKVRGYAEVSFSVNEKGRVQDLELIGTEPAEEGAVTDTMPTQLLRSLKAKHYRPRFADREPVATENLVQRYAF